MVLRLDPDVEERLMDNLLTLCIEKEIDRRRSGNEEQWKEVERKLGRKVTPEQVWRWAERR